MPRVFHNHEGSILKFLRPEFDQTKKPRRHRGGPLVPQPEDHDAGKYIASHGQKIAEIKIESEDDAPFVAGLIQDSSISEAFKTEFTKVCGIMAQISKRPDRTDRDAHIGEKSHARIALNGDDFFSREERGVLQRLPNILGVQVRVLLPDLIDRHPVGHEIDEQRYRDPHTPDARAPAHHVLVECYPV